MENPSRKNETYYFIIATLHVLWMQLSEAYDHKSLGGRERRAKAFHLNIYITQQIEVKHAKKKQRNICFQYNKFLPNFPLSCIMHSFVTFSPFSIVAAHIFVSFTRVQACFPQPFFSLCITVLRLMSPMYHKSTIDLCLLSKSSE